MLDAGSGRVTGEEKHENNGEKIRAQERKFTSLKSGVVFSMKLFLKRLLS